ncbi:hypothetical protein Poli38472_010373 [Pythium oligandrum]|uniref:Phytanoyl-CoA dioxygenase n=1 Tax=Pythium oligandrum TaxID=41045 RepID=A0A8K1C2X5_PYTOL|nr:hypothetical protein Poli38472_010373 [Pythium oligandrum]|eukprot:TMW55491.1 hypothetical protein Poli38472_010373 [Pythium oligandrum]
MKRNGAVEDMAERRKARRVESKGEASEGLYGDVEEMGVHAQWIEGLATCGYVVVPRFLTDEELKMLREESDLLVETTHEDPKRAVECIIEQGCVVDMMADCPMEDASPARVEADAYLTARRKELGRRCQRHSPPKAIPEGSSDVLKKLLFERLPYLARLLWRRPATPPARQDLFFFNEHYVVKPPQTEAEFRWHRDDDEQLAMCVHRDSIAPYLSAWCALDDISPTNGPLRFVPLQNSSSSHALQPQSICSLEEADLEWLDSHATEPVLVHSCDVIVFRSDIWHCSSQNASERIRRAFYAQYSQEPITARPCESNPLSFAIPCGSSTSFPTIED